LTQPENAMQPSVSQPSFRPPAAGRQPACVPRWPTLLRWASLLLALFLAPPLAAGQLAGPDARKVRTVVQAQLAAFAANDARRAFVLADPDIRGRFGSADHFMAMVRVHYPMVHRPAWVGFHKAETSGSTVVQRVSMVDQEGGRWLVTYLLHRQPDRQWRISACLVVPEPARLTT
jgi:hypothetical protein